jgi:uncharacterized protein involved in exopolysaccharide biosynthesis
MRGLLLLFGKVLPLLHGRMNCERSYAMGEISKPEQRSRDRSAGNQELSFTDIVGFFRRNWRFIFGAAALAMLATAGLLLVLGRKYQAVATLIIVPQRVSSDLKPPTLTVQSYQEILQSDAVIGGARKKLIEKGILPPDQLLRLGKELETRIFVSRRAEEITVAPMLQAIALGSTGEEAAAIANTWAGVFLEQTHDLVAGTTSATVQFIEQQYPEVRDRLTKLEDARVTTANDLRTQYDHLAHDWDEKITNFQNETTAQVAEYQTETRRLREQYMSQHNLDSRKAQLDALRKAYSDLQDEQARVASQLQLKQLQLEAARKQLAETPATITLQKAITDDALWRAVADSKGNALDWNALQGRSLSTQQVNPVFTELSGKVAEIEMDVNAMVPRAASLTADLARINDEMKDLEAKYRADDAGFEKLTRERQAALDQLTARRDTGLGELQRRRQSALDALKNETDTHLAQLDRTIAQQRDLFAQLGKNYNQALVAKAQENMEDVRLGAAAVPPQTAKPRGLATKSLLAAMVGGVIGLGVGMVRESWS